MNVSKRNSGNPIAQLFGQTAVYGMGIVLPRVLNYILLTPFYTRIFSLEEYGVVTELYAYVVFLLVILTYGMETGFFRFASKEKSIENIYTSVLTSVLTTSLLFILLVTVFIRPLSLLLDYSANPEYIRWLGYIVAIDAFTAIPFAQLRLKNKPVKYTIIRISEVIVNIGLNWFFLYYCERNIGEKPWLGKIYNEQVGVGYVFIANLAATLVKLLLLIPEILRVFRGRILPGVLGSILKYSYPVMIAGLAGAINEALDRVLLKHLIDPSDSPMAQLGVYGANIKIAVLMTLYVQMFRYAAEPFFFSRSEDRNAKGLYADVLTFFLIPGLLIFLVVTLYLDVFKLFIGSDFREGTFIVPVVLMANLMMGVLFNLSVWYKLTDKTMVGAILILTGALVTIFVNVIFVPSFGYAAAAWGHLITYSVMVIISYLWSRKHYPIPYRLWRMIMYIALTIIVYVLYLWLSGVSPQIINVIKPLLIIMTLAIFAGLEWNTLKKYRI